MMGCLLWLDRNRISLNRNLSSPTSFEASNPYDRFLLSECTLDLLKSDIGKIEYGRQRVVN